MSGSPQLTHSVDLLSHSSSFSGGKGVQKHDRPCLVHERTFTVQHLVRTQRSFEVHTRTLSFVLEQQKLMTLACYKPLIDTQTIMQTLLRNVVGGLLCGQDSKQIWTKWT